MESKNLKDLREKRKQWFSQMEHSLLGPGPETKSQGTGLLIKVAIARYARNKGTARPMSSGAFVCFFLMMPKWFQETLVGSLRGE